MRTSLLALVLTLSACGGDAGVQAPPAPPESTSGKPASEQVAATPTPEGPGAFVALDPTGRRVFFVEPADGATVTSPLKVVFGAEGVEIKPAGDLTPNSGHHHLILDAPASEAGSAVPADANHLHFGGGQTETTVELSPGEHTLTMQLADFAHRSYGPGFSATLKVTVTE
jgi:hypothetical protein